MPAIFPFTAIVGQERMKRALILNAINPLIGGVLIRGERGTAKSPAVRALAALLPEIEVVADCRFGCNPHDSHLCDECMEREARGEVLPIARRKVRLVDLPVSATEDRVVGTLDIETAIKRGEKKFESIDALRSQIDRDYARAVRYFQMEAVRNTDGLGVH